MDMIDTNADTQLSATYMNLCSLKQTRLTL